MTTVTPSSELSHLDADRLPFEVFVFLTDWKSAITPEQADNFFRSLRKGRRWSQSALGKYLRYCLKNYPNYWKDYSRTKEKYTADKLFYRLKEMGSALSAEEYTKLKVDIIHLAALILTGRPYRDKVTDAHPTFQLLDDIIHHRYAPTQPSGRPSDRTVDGSGGHQGQSSAPNKAVDKGADSPQTSGASPDQLSQNEADSGQVVSNTGETRTDGGQQTTDSNAADQQPPNATNGGGAPTLGESQGSRDAGQPAFEPGASAKDHSPVQPKAPGGQADLQAVDSSVALAKLEAERGNPQEFMPYAYIAPAKDNFWVKGKIDLTCTRVITETHDVKTFLFTANPPCFFQYKPGQFVTLELIIDGKKTFRSYTLSSTPSRPNVLSMTVKRVPGGLVSNWLHDNVSVGTVVKAKGPYGSFTIFDHPHPKILLISAGSGATPMMAMLRWLIDTNATIDVNYFHWASTKQDIIFHEELEYYNSRCANMELNISLTREDAYSEWDGLREYVSKDLIEGTCPDFMERRIFVCGPDGFMKKTRQLISEWGFPAEYYHEETFGVVRPKKGAALAASAKTMPQALSPDATKPAAGTAPSRPSSAAAGSPATPPSASRASASSAAKGPTASPAPPKGPLPDRLAPAVKVPAGVKDLISVQFTDSHLEMIHKDAELTILEMADECGVEIPSSCRSGTCGTCKARKIIGSVNMEGAAGLDEDEEAEGYILTCVSYAEGFVKIEA